MSIIENYFFPLILLIKKITIAMMARTIKMPTPTPALKIPSIRSQLVSVSVTANRTNRFLTLFVIISGFNF